MTKICTSIEQSKKLAEILPIESADMYYWCGDDLRIGGYKAMNVDCDIPAWSLDVLLDTLKLFTTPTAFSVKVCVPLLAKTNNGYSLTYTGDYTLMGKNNSDIAAPIEIVADTPVDACVEMIVKLHEMNLL